MTNQKNDRCSPDQDRLIRYAYGDLPLFAKLTTRRHLSKCQSCRAVVEQHRIISKKLSKNRKQNLPPHIMAEIMSRTGAQDHSQPIPWRTAIATAAIIAIVTGWMVMETPAPHRSQQYSPAEVSQARDQVEKALGILGVVMGNTSQAVKDDVLDKEVVNPLEKSVEKALQPLIDGGSS
ncbi:hypothetical protein GF406_24390 [candidate division KSB1 bacterium]|nr:hypothetical protein [candidate division KSB1 bacterium]